MSRLEVTRGDTLRVTIEARRDGDPVTIEAIRWVADGLWDLTLGNGITVAVPTSGDAVAEIDAATLALLTAGSVQQECKVREPDGTVSTVFSGYVTVRQSLIGSDLDPEEAP